MHAPPALALALAALAIAGCTDPSIDVVFDVPDDYEDLTRTVKVDVIAPGDALWQCADIEFGEIGEQDLVASEVDHAELGPDGDDSGFDNVPRRGLKLFYARAYNELGQLVAAGCASHELVEGEATVVIAGQPATFLSARVTQRRETGDLARLQVGVSDARGNPLPDVPVRYRVVSANGSTSPAEADSDDQGSLDLELDSPPWFGPQAVDVDVPWQANQIEPVTGFRRPAPRFAVEVAPADQIQDLPSEQIYQIGRIGPDGEMGIAVLGPASGTEGRLVHLYIAQGAGLADVTAAAPVHGGALGLVAAGARDRVLVLDENAWHEIAPDGAVTSHQQSLGLGGDAHRIIALPSACEQGAPRDRMLVDAGAGLVVLSADLEPVASPLAADASLLAAGCVIGNTGVNPAAVWDHLGAIQLMAEIDGARSAPWPNAIRRGIAFTPLLGEEPGSGPFALGNLTEVDGDSIARHTLVRGPGDRLALDVELEDEVAGTSIATTGGDFDGDGLLDVAGLVLVANLNGTQEARVFTALGATLEGVRLAGQSPALAPDAEGTQRYLDSELFAADLDGDGYDELIVASRNRFDVYSLEP
ncbi:MAG TPA: hypothetical protein VKB80_26815 [Kofleriaceae bacterium]|nr:hypothetical protein [Kofleriaceae bacterium]